MIELGKINTLEILRTVSFGSYLGKDGDEVLLPTKYEKKDFKVGDWIEVFVYLDNEERAISTTLTPKITLNSFAVLKVKQITKYGAFFDMGIEKDLFVPFKEQKYKVKENDCCVVYMYLDKKTGRLVGSTKILKFLDSNSVDLSENQEVTFLIYEKNQWGYAAVVENQYKGMLFKSDVYETLTIGTKMEGYVKRIREDHRIDLRLYPIDMQGIEYHSQKVLDTLKNANGFLNLNDKSNPEIIKKQLNMSKKSFKKAVGVLYKKQLINLKAQGIELRNL